MGELRDPERACFLMGALCKEKRVLSEYCEYIKEFGDPCLVSPLYDFDFTDYYHETMGSPLYRRFYIYWAGISQE